MTVHADDGARPPKPGAAGAASREQGFGPTPPLDPAAWPPIDGPPIESHVEMAHQLAAASGAEGCLVAFAVGQNPITGRKVGPYALHFAIGDTAAMVTTIKGWCRQPHLNVYVPWAVFRKNLPRGAKGEETDVVAVLALVADQDNDKGVAGTLPCPAPYVIESSPGNYQAVYPLSRALTLAEGKPIGQALADALGGDTGPGVMSHVWRVPGTLNWPIRSKLKRGRSQMPQPVTVATPWTGELIEPETLRAAIADMPRKPRKPGNGRGPAGAGARLFGGNLDALRDCLDHIPPEPRTGYDPWLKVGMCVHHETAGSDEGLEIWRAWSRPMPNFDGPELEKKSITGRTLAKLARDETGWIKRPHDRPAPDGQADPKPNGSAVPEGDREPRGVPPADAGEANRGPIDEGRADPGDDALDAELHRLATLGTRAYERERKAAAKRLDMRTVVLDRLVAAERGEEPDARKLTLPEIAPWPEPVNGAEVLNGITAAIRDHLVVGQAMAEAMTLWAIHAHAHGAAQISPRLAFTSPTKRCGKTTALQIVQALVPRPMPAANITAAALFRAVEAVKPTLLIDEADTFLKNSDELRGILNSGHNRAGAYVVRTVGDDHTPAQFRTWAPVAVAMIGDLPGTLADRSVIVEMQRKKRGDVARRFRADRTEEFALLARKAARFAEDALEDLREWDGEVPERLHDRAADNWRPLLAIAERAGGDWPRRARAAALALSGVEDDDPDEAGVQLLADMRDIFARFGPKVATITILAQLNEMETRPWPEFKAGKPLTTLQLATLLRPFKVKPKVVRDGEHTFRGYEEQAFRDVFARYLPLDPLHP